MKKFMKFTANVALALAGMVAFCLLVGEPAPESNMSIMHFLTMKALSIAAIYICVKLALIINPAMREEIESEEV